MGIAVAAHTNECVFHQRIELLRHHHQWLQQPQLLNMMTVFFQVEISRQNARVLLGGHQALVYKSTAFWTHFWQCPTIFRRKVNQIRHQSLNILKQIKNPLL